MGPPATFWDAAVRVGPIHEPLPSTRNLEMRNIRRFAPPVTGEQIPAPEQQTAPVQVTIIVPHSPLAPRRRNREPESGWRLL